MLTKILFLLTKEFCPSTYLTICKTKKNYGQPTIESSRKLLILNIQCVNLFVLNDYTVFA